MPETKKKSDDWYIAVTYSPTGPGRASPRNNRTYGKPRNWLLRKDVQTTPERRITLPTDDSPSGLQHGRDQKA